MFVVVFVVVPWLPKDPALVTSAFKFTRLTSFTRRFLSKVGKGMKDKDSAYADRCFINYDTMYTPCKRKIEKINYFPYSN